MCLLFSAVILILKYNSDSSAKADSICVIQTKLIANIFSIPALLFLIVQSSHGDPLEDASNTLY